MSKKQEQEIKTEVEKKPYEKVELATLIVEEITVITDKESKFVTQVRFKIVDEELDLTYKPKIRTEEKTVFNGLAVIKKFSKSITLEELPKKLYQLNKLINSDGEVKILTDYTIMNTVNRDDEPISYKFLTDKDFDNLYPLDSDNKEITLEN